MFTIRKANLRDVPEIRNIMVECNKLLENKSWYYIDDDDEKQISHIISDCGFALIAEFGSTTAGFLIVYYPGNDDGNLGAYVRNEDVHKEDVAHMESVAVLPKFRGNGLQRMLVGIAESFLKENIKYIMCTVHPDNYPSFSSFTRCGYNVINNLPDKYDGLQRYVLLKKR